MLVLDSYNVNFWATLNFIIINCIYINNINIFRKFYFIQNSTWNWKCNFNACWWQILQMINSFCVILIRQIFILRTYLIKFWNYHILYVNIIISSRIKFFNLLYQINMSQHIFHFNRIMHFVWQFKFFIIDRIHYSVPSGTMWKHNFSTTPKSISYIWSSGNVEFRIRNLTFINSQSAGMRRNT